METIELSQKELSYLIAALNKLVESGGLQTGDVRIIAPIVEKIEAKRVTEPEPQAAS